MPLASDLTAMPDTRSSATLASYLFLAERLFAFVSACAIDVITLITWPISALDSPSFAIVVFVVSAVLTAAVATFAASVVFFAISLMLAPISSALPLRRVGSSRIQRAPDPGGRGSRSFLARSLEQCRNRSSIGFLESKIDGSIRPSSHTLPT